MPRQDGLRVAVIGAGRMGAIRAEDLAADPRVSEVLLANRTEERAAAVAAPLGARVIPWADAVRAEADAVVVATGTDTHPALLEALLPRGLPVLCEKPIAATLGETERLIALAERSGAPLQVGFQRRFDPGFAAVRADIDAGRLGTVYQVRMASHDIAPSPRAFIAGSGGIFRDLHVHDLDLLRWLTGSEIATVHATKAVRAHAQYAEFDDADATAIHAVTASGVQAVITGARHDARGHDVRIEVLGSGDSVSAGLNARTPLRAVEGFAFGDDPYAGFVDRFREAFRAETGAFVSFACGTTANPCPPDAARESLRAAIACEESARTGLPVRVAGVTGP